MVSTEDEDDGGLGALNERASSRDVGLARTAPPSRAAAPVTSVSLWARLASLADLIRGRVRAPPVSRGRTDHEGEFGALLLRLDQPMHLFAYLTGGNHYHFGEFQRGADSLLRAQERLAETCADHFAPRSSILDVGCGLGGSSLLLARRGHRVLGVDPCAAALDVARASANGNGRLRFDELPGERGSVGRWLTDPAFDGVLFLEVLQYYPRLDDTLEELHGLTRPGSVLVFADTFCDGPFASRGTPHHGVGELSLALRRAGLAELDRRDLTAAVLPTLDVLRGLLDEQRSELLGFFGTQRPDVEREVDELRAHCLHLATALRNGDLVYDLVAARRDR